MEILEIRMDHFGKFSGQNMKFHPGINIIYGENETGKSTMGAFIRSMFYGLARQRGRAAEQDEYHLREPWVNGSFFAGSMRVQHQGKVYRIERSFGKKEEALRLICETDGREEADAGKALQAMLQGMDESAFSNTVFLGRPGGQTDAGLAQAVQNEMLSAQAKGDRRINAAGALEGLNRERKRLEREKKQRTAAKVEQMQEWNMKADFAAQELEDLEKRRVRLQERLQKLDEETASEEDAAGRAPEAWEGPKDTFNGWKAGKIVMAVLAAGALAAGILLPEWRARMGAAAVILLACAGEWFFGVRDQARQKRVAEQRLQERERYLEDRYARTQEALQRQRETAPRRRQIAADLEWTGNAIREKGVLLDGLRAQIETLSWPDKETEEMERDIAALFLAIDTLQEVTAEIYQEHARRLNEDVSGILAQITAGRYTGVFLDEQLQVRIQTPQKLLSIWQVSRGTMEQIYFALRMACAGFLDAQETLPLILDDAFAAYDDARLEAALRWLYSCGRQVLLFTCHRREQQLMEKIVP